MATETMVLELPDCDVCKVEFPSSDPNPATVDGKMTTGQWAYMCEDHFESVGVGLGTGQGQRLILAVHETGEKPERIDTAEIVAFREFLTGKGWVWEEEVTDEYERGYNVNPMIFPDAPFAKLATLTFQVFTPDHPDGILVNFPLSVNPEQEPDGYVDPAEIPPENTGTTDDF